MKNCFKDWSQSNAELRLEKCLKSHTVLYKAMFEGHMNRPCYKQIVLKRDTFIKYLKENHDEMKWSFSFNSLVKFHG